MTFTRTATYAIAAFALCSIAAAVRSPGFIESDGATHYLFARHAFEQPIYFLDIWGRPLCTALFAAPAWFGGLLGVRLTSLLVAIACALVAAAIARGQGYRWPMLALIFTLGQPLLFLHSFSELTELPFALVVGLAFLSYQRRRWGWMATMAAIAPLGRPEGFAFLLLAAAALAAHRKWRCLLLLPLGVLAWSILGHALVGPPQRHWWLWLADHWPYESGSEYPRGPLLYFLAVLPVLVGPFAFPAMWIGIWRSLAGARPLSRLREHQLRVDALIAALPLAILVGHSLLFWLGKFSSSGSLRYLLIVAPLWGCLSARGWEWAFTLLRWPRPLSWAALAVVLPGLVNYCWRILPVRQSESWSEAQQFAQWYQSSPLRKQFPRIMTSHPGIFFYLNANPWDRRQVEPWARPAIDDPPPGVLLIWDPEFSVGNSDPLLVVPLQRAIHAGWLNDPRAEWQSDVNGAGMLPDQPATKTPRLWHVFLSPAGSLK
ncbi:MAG: hypothetical protein ABSB74_11760 [Tepidisphaeraceae bacterium]